MASVQRYNLAQFVFEDTEIPMKTFKTTRKQTVEKLEACNSHDPYAVMFGKEELSWDCSDIDPIYRKFFEDVLDRQKADPTDLALVSTYDYSEITGDVEEDDVFDEEFLSEDEHSDDQILFEEDEADNIIEFRYECNTPNDKEALNNASKHMDLFIKYERKALDYRYEKNREI